MKTYVSGKLFKTIKSLYSSVTSCVRVNNMHTDWFDVKCGLRQGCILSPILFNLYINDLVLYLKSFGKGVKCNDDYICTLLYADDVVLLAETEQDLQVLLEALNVWCLSNNMTVNVNKSNIVHFRNPSVKQTDGIFKCGNSILNIVDSYTYLGVLLTEHLDFELTAKFVAQSASRALGLLIAKYKLAGGLPYNVYTKLYKSVVCPVIEYSASIWGFKSYSCINAVQNRAMRVFLGVGKYTPTAALHGELGWEPCISRQWLCIGRHVARKSCTNSSRLNKRIALWASAYASPRCRNWFFVFAKRCKELNLNFDVNISCPISKIFVNSLHSAILQEYKVNWFTSINSKSGPSGRGNNKLRTYCQFKSVYEVEQYCKMILSLRHRAAFAKFRCGVAPLRIESGRFENIPLEERKCFFCNAIESESHALLDCILYTDLRSELFAKAQAVNEEFIFLSAEQKLIFLFSNHKMIRHCAKTCFNILQRRAFYLCK